MSLGNDLQIAVSAVHALAEKQSPESIKALIRAGVYWTTQRGGAIRTQEFSVQDTISQSLQEMGKQVVPFLLAESHSEQSPEFLIRTLAGFGPKIEPILKTTLEKEMDFRVRLTTALALEEMGKKTIPVILPILQTSESALRAVEFVQHVRLPSSTRLLIEILKSNDVTVWLKTRQAILQTLNDQTVWEAIIGLTDPDPQVRANLVYVLGYLPEQGVKALPGIGNLLGDESEEVRLIAAQALVAIGTDEAYDKLEWGLFHAHKDIRLSVSESLVSSLTPRGIGLLETLLQSEDFSLQVLAIESLSRILKLELVDEEPLYEGDDEWKVDQDQLQGAKQIARAALKKTYQGGNSKVRLAIAAYTETKPKNSELKKAVKAIEKKDEELYLVALEVLRKKPDRKRIELIISLLGYYRKEVTNTALDVLFLSDSREAVGPLMLAFDGANQTGKVNILWALEYYKDPSTVPFLIRALHIPDELVVRAATEALVPLADGAVKEFINALSIKNKRARVSLIFLLGETESPDAVQPLIHLLETETDESALNELGAALIRIGEPTLEPLALLLFHERPLVRIISASAMGEIPSVRSVYELINAVGDENQEVVDTIAYGLIQLQKYSVPILIDSLNLRDLEFQQQITVILASIGTPAVGPLIQASTDESPTRRAWSVVALGEIGNPDAVDFLIPRFRDEEEEIQKRAAIALIQIGDPAVPALISVNDSERGLIRLWSTVALGEIQNPSAVPKLIERLNDEEESVSLEAQKALVNIGKPGVPALFDTLVQNPDEQTTEKIRHVFAQMEDPEALAMIKKKLDDSLKATAEDELQQMLQSID